MLPSVEGFGGFLPQIWDLQAIKGGVATLWCTSYRACAGCMQGQEVQLPSGAIACHVRRANLARPPKSDSLGIKYLTLTQ